MKIDEQLDIIRRKHPKFGRQAIYDVDLRGVEFCEIIYPNAAQPLMPITVSVSEDGCLVSVGKISNVTGDRPITAAQACEAISDIISDKVAFVLGYPEDDDTLSGPPFMTEIFPLTGEVDDTSADFDKFIAKLSTPVTGFKRKLTKLKGSFLVTDFSGGRNKIIVR